ncbi:unnamed protein product [Leptosia nina]|uniref:Methyltransferase-like protein 4 n=1 Tax=Leptosia nina TaxID=320188 RepID=A0AAV1JN87_9NEOP
MYSKVDTRKSGCKSFAITTKLFSIKRDKKKKLMKRNHDDNIHEEASAVKAMYCDLIKILPSTLKNATLNKYDLLDSSTVRDLSKQLFESTKFDHSGLSGGNNSETPVMCDIKGEQFLIPAKCRFLCGCVKEQCQKLHGNKYDIVIADPPWWNKYIRRLKTANDKMGYSMMYNEDIASLPISNVLADTCLIAVWCTNSPSNISAVKNLIFPNWGVEYVTTWFWLKLTIDLEPLCDFGSGSQKQPYERVLIGRKGNIKVNEDVLFASVPSSLHSHKPPLLDILSPLLPREEPRVLELFARYLLSNTTSVGFEPLKWQHLSLYENT